MSEIPASYQTGNELEKALKDLENSLRDVTENPDTSIWLRKAIAELWSRDTTEALGDLETLQMLLKAKNKADLLMLGRWTEAAIKH